MAEFEEAAELVSGAEAGPKAVILGTVGLVFSLLFSLLMFLPAMGRPDYMVGRFDATGPVAQVHYRGQAWVPAGPATNIEDDHMVAVERTDEAYFIYAVRGNLGGGGGGGIGGLPELGAHPEAYGQVYLRTEEGLFQPVVPQR